MKLFLQASSLFLTIASSIFAANLTQHLDAENFSSPKATKRLLSLPQDDSQNTFKKTRFEDRYTVKTPTHTENVLENNAIQQSPLKQLPPASPSRKQSITPTVLFSRITDWSEPNKSDIQLLLRTLKGRKFAALRQKTQQIRNLTSSTLTSLPTDDLMKIALYCPNLEAIDLSKREISQAHIARLKTCANTLNSIDFTGSIVEDEAIFTLISFAHNLKKVGLERVRTTREAICELITHCPKLETLDLAYYNTPEDSILEYFLEELAENCPALETLSLAGCTTSLTRQARRSINRCENLTYLDLSCSRANSAETVQKLVAYHPCPLSVNAGLIPSMNQLLLDDISFNFPEAPILYHTKYSFAS